MDSNTQQIKSNIVDIVSDTIIGWMGSNVSVVLHTLFFLGALLSPVLFNLSFDTILLVLTTVVSLEAIYLSLFIQRSVNKQSIRLGDVEEALDDVEESVDNVEKALDDVEESVDNVEKALDDVEESVDNVEKSLDDVEKALDETEEDIADIAGDTARKLEQPIDEMILEMREMLKELKSTLLNANDSDQPKSK